MMLWDRGFTARDSIGYHSQPSWRERIKPNMGECFSKGATGGVGSVARLVILSKLRAK